MALTGKQRRQLRALGHHLTPVVQVGQQGVTKGVLAAVSQALEDHELIKVKIPSEDRRDTAAELADGTQAEVAQVLGRTVLLFRKRKKDSRFDSFDKALAAAGVKQPKKKAPAAAKARAPQGAPEGAPEGADEGADEDEEEEEADAAEDE